jgi:hypothetical protein
MKLKILLMLLMISAFILEMNAQNLVKVWETPPLLSTAESVIYDPGNDLIYVSCINGNPSEKDGKGFISVLTSAGEIKTLEWVKGLNAPKGLGIHDGKLYVADIDHLVEIDMKDGKILKKYEARGAQFLNDVTTCPDGKVFVSDMMTKKIHLLKDGEFSVWLHSETFNRPNGLFAENGKLYVGDHEIFEIDMATKEIKSIIKDAGGVDGLEKTHEGDFIFSHWAGRIFLHKGNQTIKLMDTSEQNINTADIDYAIKLGLVLVPTFFDNRVIAFKIQL